MKSDTSVRLLCGATITHDGEPSEAEKACVVYAVKVFDDDGCLYAAAPDMLEALKECLLRLDHHDDQSAPEALLARAAILKAEGKL